jgi:plasmid segregation protein ParM
MELTVRAVDVGFGNTKYVSAVNHTAAGTEIRCGSFPSLAYPSPDGHRSWPGTERRKTLFIPVGKLHYEVGPDVALAADSFQARQLHDEYSDSPEYLALVRGALAMMKLSHIDLLVVGLPVAQFVGRKATLERAMTGRHEVGEGKVVTVGKALAVAQPQGALVHYASVQQKVAEIGKEQNLVIDPGSRTFDWLVARGMRLVENQSHSINRGISDIVRHLALAITREIGTPYRDHDAIDVALRTGKSPVIYQKPYDMKHLMPYAESIAQQAVSSMKEWIETPQSLQNIILVGGGAFLFRRAVKAAFPKHKVHEVKDPIYANVRGFQIAGQNYARSVMASSREGVASAAAGDAA